MRLIKNGDTSHVISVLMIDSADHVSGKTGLTLTVTRSKNGAAFASWSGTTAEVSAGWYKLTPAAGDVDTQGDLAIHVTATGADPTDAQALVVAFDPHDAGDLGLTNLDVASSTLATAANLATVAGYLDTEVAAVLAAVDTEVTAILADTNELQADWADGGRLDLILDARASQTSVDTIDDFLDTEVAAIKAKTDNLPSSPAAVGSAMTLDLTQTVTDVTGSPTTLGGILSVLRSMANGRLTIVSGVLRLFGTNGSTEVGTTRTITGTVPTDTTRA